MVDAHTWWRMGDRSYSFETVEQLADEMADYDVAWLEEPLPPDDHEAYLRLKEKDYLPLASGEHEPSEERYLGSDPARRPSITCRWMSAARAASPWAAACSARSRAPG